MNCENYKDKIIAYIENDLSDDSREAFEIELKENPKLLHEYNEMKNFLNLMNKIPEVKTNRNFMIDLNNKIDDYENSKNKSLFDSFINRFSYGTIAQGAAALAFICVIFFGYNALDQSEDQPLMLSKSNLSNDNSINLTDSEIDSLLDVEDVDIIFE